MIEIEYTNLHCTAFVIVGQELYQLHALNQQQSKYKHFLLHFNV